ncbi:YeeE/YedE thiosulfate transporter family protein [Staphylococcus aureus]
MLQLEDQENLNGNCGRRMQYRNSAIGGICMGFGASVAGGCSIGNGFVETATMTFGKDGLR